MAENENKTQVTIPAETLKTWNLFIAVPCYDSTVTEPFMMSLIRTMLHFEKIGVRLTISTLTDSLISRSRNMLLAKFMSDDSYTHFMFIDSDIGFAPESVLKLLWHDKEVIAAAYPVKEINWKKIEELVSGGMSIEEATKTSARFAFSAIQPGQTSIEVSKGAVTAYDLGTGFMMIKRETVEKMIEAYPELKYSDDTGGLNEKEQKFAYNFFNPHIDSRSRYLSEDYAFCRYWQQLGGKTWLDPDIELVHVGRYVYTGSARACIDTLIVKD